MRLARISQQWLRLQLMLRRLNPIAAGALLLCALAGAAVLWLVEARAGLVRRRVVQNIVTVPLSVPAKTLRAIDAGSNLTLFQSALGERRYAEQQLKTLFGLAEKAGLVLTRGDYKLSYDKDAKLYSYQINLPVKGSYAAIWQFALLALRAMPFASLDEIGFKRETIGDANVEGRLRMTLYLSDAVTRGAQ